MSARTVADLSTRDIGTTITLTGRDWTITGPLRQVSTVTDWISEQTAADPMPAEVAGRTSTHLQIGPFHAEVSNPGAITVQEARPRAMPARSSTAPTGSGAPPTPQRPSAPPSASAASRASSPVTSSEPTRSPSTSTRPRPSTKLSPTSATGSNARPTRWSSA